MRRTKAADTGWTCGACSSSSARLPIRSEDPISGACTRPPAAAVTGGGVVEEVGDSGSPTRPKTHLRVVRVVGWSLIFTPLPPSVHLRWPRVQRGLLLRRRGRARGGCGELGGCPSVVPTSVHVYCPTRHEIGAPLRPPGAYKPTFYIFGVVARARGHVCGKSDGARAAGCSSAHHRHAAILARPGSVTWPECRGCGSRRMPRSRPPDALRKGGKRC